MTIGQAGLVGDSTDRSAMLRDDALERPVDLTKEIELPPEVRCGVLPGPGPAIRKVFLTGATGFLGVHLLRELLERTSAEIHCLVRCEDPTAGYQRIELALREARLWNEHYRNRLVVIAGGLERPQFGLSQGEFNVLASEIDVIYHNGARVNLAHAYSVLKSVNVLATRDILLLAATHHVKPVHYVSTVGVLGRNVGFIDEGMTVGYHSGLIGGYEQSKWVADQMVCQAAERGLPATIYRPSRMVGHSVSGYVNTDDLFCRLIRGVVTLGMAPRNPGYDNILPVDCASRIIVEASLNRKAWGRAINVVNPTFVSFESLVDFIELEGHRVERVSYGAWLSEVRLHVESHPQFCLASLLPMLSRFNPEADPSVARFLPMAADNMAELAGSAVVSAIPPISRILRTCFDYLYATGYIERNR